MSLLGAGYDSGDESGEEAQPQARGRNGKLGVSTSKV